MIRILLADGHEVLRRGLRLLLEQHEGWEVCAEASNGREAVELSRQLCPHVVVLDLAMHGLEAIRHIRKAHPQTEVLIFTVHESDDLTYAALQAGARGYLIKSDDARQIVAAIEALAQHQAYFTWNILKRILRTYLAESDAIEGTRSLDTLTVREREVLQLLAEGRTHKAVSTILGIGLKTVETHRSAIMKKLGFSSIAQLVRFAVRNRVIEA